MDDFTDFETVPSATSAAPPTNGIPTDGFDPDSAIV